MYPIDKYNFKHYETTNKDGTKTQVIVALSTYAGRTVKGVAKCMEGDEFSLEKGKELAASRCNLKVLGKRLDSLSEKLCKAEEVLASDQKNLEELREYFNKTFNDYCVSICHLGELEAQLEK